MKTTFVPAKAIRLAIFSLAFIATVSSQQTNAQACSLVNSLLNLLSNGNFETNANGWTTSNGSIYSGTGYAICGTRNGYVSSPGNGTPTWAYTELPLVSVNNNIQMAGYFGTHAAGQNCNPIVRLAAYDNTWKLLKEETKNVTTNVDAAPYKPGLYVLNMKIPAGTVHIRLEIRISCDYMKIDAVSVAQTTTLPVQLMNFNAALVNNKANLSWKTAAEVNFNYFTVEKSFDGKTFQDAAMVFAAGNASSETNYVFADNLATTNAPVVYYRLRMTDNDGTARYSDIRMLNLKKQVASDIILSTYPNPAGNEVRVTVPANWQNKAALYEVINLNGQVVNSRPVAIASQTETINISRLAPGLYVIRVQCEGQTAQQKIVKQ